MKQNVLFWVGVKSEDEHLREKHGDFKYLDISEKCWRWWCDKNDVIFFKYDTPSEPDTSAHKVTWQRWFDVFKLIEEANINYDKIAVIDGSTLVKWNTPNFLELADDMELIAFRSLENLRWISESVDGYKELMGGFDFNISKYISCGFQIFDKNHKPFLKKLKDFYYNNYDKIIKNQNELVRKGTDQSVYNYLLQIENIKVNLNFPPSFMLNHLSRFDWFSNNWQVGKDKTPFFIKYGYIWFYSGFPRRGDRYDLMKTTWDYIKHKYDD